jgi:hypothetical protein
MSISRRGFLQSAAGLSAAIITPKPLLSGFSFGPEANGGPSVLLDCGENCSLRESLSGFEGALEATKIPFLSNSMDTHDQMRTLIAPAAVLTNTMARWVRTQLEGGVSVLFESGAAFLPRDKFIFQQRCLQAHFGLVVKPPINIWDGSELPDRSPYLDYRWPTRAKVRDFSFVLPVSVDAGEPIALLGKIAVALRKKIGRGTLVFLGSPIGPHLLAGDPQAQRWFSKFCAQA